MGYNEVVHGSSWCSLVQRFEGVLRQARNIEPYKSGNTVQFLDTHPNHICFRWLPLGNYSPVIVLSLFDADSNCLAYLVLSFCRLRRSSVDPFQPPAQTFGPMANAQKIWDPLWGLYFVNGKSVPLSELEREPVKVTCEFDLPEDFPNADKYEATLISITEPIAQAGGWSEAVIMYVLACSCFFGRFSITLQLLFPGRFNRLNGTSLS
jgi:hypothetical protein